MLSSTVGGSHLEARFLPALVLTKAGRNRPLTAAIASRFVKDDRILEHHELVAMLRRIEADVAELKAADRDR